MVVVVDVLALYVTTVVKHNLTKLYLDRRAKLKELSHLDCFA